MFSLKFKNNPNYITLFVAITAKLAMLLSKPFITSLEIFLIILDLKNCLLF